jgi:hypothetical protein
MSGMRQIVLPPHPSGSGFAHETGRGRSWTESLFQVRLTPRDLTKRFGFRFQESREDGLSDSPPSLRTHHPEDPNNARSGWPRWP